MINYTIKKKEQIILELGEKIEAQATTWVL